MKTYVSVNGQKIDATIYGHTRDMDWDNRESKAIKVAMTYDQTKALFVDDVLWSIVQEYDPIRQTDGSTVTPEPVTYDNSDFCIAGPITDNRDGTVTVKMGKPLPGETLEILAGKPIRSVTQAKTMRQQVECTYQAATMTTDERIANRFMAAAWVKGKHTVGEVYCTTPDCIWKCRQDYDNKIFPGIVPEDPSWYTFNIPLHGTTPETALPFVAPKEAESRYKAGEYMIWTDSKIYKCIQDTSYNPEEYAAAWEKQQ